MPLFYTSGRRSKNNNAQQEYYLPDILYHLLDDNINVVPFYIKDENEIVNVNNIDQLKKAKNILEHITVNNQLSL